MKGKLKLELELALALALALDRRLHSEGHGKVHLGGPRLVVVELLRSELLSRELVMVVEAVGNKAFEGKAVDGEHMADGRSSSCSRPCSRIATTRILLLSISLKPKSAMFSQQRSDRTSRDIFQACNNDTPGQLARDQYNSIIANMEPVLNTPAEPISNAPTEPTLSTPPDTISDTPVEPTLNTPIPPSSSTPLQLPASPPTEITSSTPAEATSSVRKRKQLTRDQRLQIHTLRKAGHSYEFIVDFFKPDKVTFRQVAYAATQPIEPQNHKCGAKPKLDAETRRQVKDLMGKSTGPRPITYKEVSTQLGLGVSESTLRRARMYILIL